MLRALISSLLAVIVVPGCQSSTATTTAAPQEAAVLEQFDPASIEGEWTVAEIGGLPVEAERPPDLVIGIDGRISGFGGVNRFNTALNLDLVRNGWFAIGEIASTRMAGPPEVMDLESRYFNALRSANRYYFDGGDLYLVRGDSVFVRLTRPQG